MTTNSIPGRGSRPAALLADYSRRYPNAWRVAEEVRAARIEGGEERWPGWCYIPSYDTAHEIAGDGAAEDEAGVLDALLRWRVTKGVYHFDRRLFAGAWASALAYKPERLPLEEEPYMAYLLDPGLPEWCCYVPVPEGLEPSGPHRGLCGFFVWLGFDAKLGVPDVHLVLDRGNGNLEGLAVELEAPTLMGCLRVAQERVRMVPGLQPLARGGDLGEEARYLVPLMQLALCLVDRENYSLSAADGSDRRPLGLEPGSGANEPAKEVRAWHVDYADPLPPAPRPMGRG